MDVYIISYTRPLKFGFVSKLFFYKLGIDPATIPFLQITNAQVFDMLISF